MIGIAFTGSGKTLVFALPLFLYALSEEVRAPLAPRMGPLGMIICPSRELAEQSASILRSWAAAGVRAGAPEVRCMLSIGGTSIRESFAEYDRAGAHMLVGTPGRVLHLLNDRKMNLSQCVFLCLDEADRLIDLGFEDSIRDIVSHFPHQRQTLLFSATMPLKIAQFAKSALVRPVIVNVGRAGAAVASVRQDLEYVADEDRIVHLLRALQKTPPPVLVFAENQRDVDDIHEFFLLRNVEAVSIHGGKSQQERSEAVRLFKEGKKDVLVAGDVAAKGLDFPDVQHVINFDMPREIENYVHRIGRTGRGGKKGVATTFLGPNCQETILLDLRGLLEEAKQTVPDFLRRIQGETLAGSMQRGNAQGCAFCGGLGHRILACPKLENERRKQLAVGSQHGDMGGGI
jgi:ATP-dependent RNA helicase DDX41